MNRSQPEPVIKVLIVEQHMAAAASLRRILEQWFHSPLDILATTSAREAIVLARECAVDLMIAHVTLAEGDGLTLCRTVRQMPVLAQLPIMLLGEGTSARAKILGFTSGADDYIVRPIDDRLLVARFRLLLRLKSIDRLHL